MQAEVLHQTAKGVPPRISIYMCKSSSCQEQYGDIYTIMVTLCKILSVPAVKK